MRRRSSWAPCRVEFWSTKLWLWVRKEQSHLSRNVGWELNTCNFQETHWWRNWEAPPNSKNTFFGKFEFLSFFLPFTVHKWFTKKCPKLSQHSTTKDQFFTMHNNDTISHISYTWPKSGKNSPKLIFSPHWNSFAHAERKQSHLHTRGQKMLIWLINKNALLRRRSYALP